MSTHEDEIKTGRCKKEEKSLMQGNKVMGDKEAAESAGKPRQNAYTHSSRLK